MKTGVFSPSMMGQRISVEDRRPISPSTMDERIVVLKTGGFILPAWQTRGS